MPARTRARIGETARWLVTGLLAAVVLWWELRVLADYSAHGKAAIDDDGVCSTNSLAWNLFASALAGADIGLIGTLAVECLRERAHRVRIWLAALLITASAVAIWKLAVDATEPASRSLPAEKCPNLSY